MGKTHIAMVPFSAYGHRAPMLELVRLLASQGFLVTLLLIKDKEEEDGYGHDNNSSSSSSSSSSSNIIEEGWVRFVSLNLEVKVGDGTSGVKAMCIALEGLGGPILDALSGLQPPLGCMISDYNLAATKDASQELGIPRIGFCPHMLAAFSIYCCLPHPEVPSNGVIQEVKEIASFPGVRPISSKELPWFSVKDDEMKCFYGFLLRVMKNLEGEESTKWLLCNSVYELERPAMDALMNVGVPLLPIDPLFLASLGSDKRSRGMQKRSEGDDMSREGSYKSGNDDENWSEDADKRSVCLWQEDHTCLKWLDGHLEGSVVFVSFGSITIFVKEQLGEIALGLEASGRPFLWVLRPGLVNKDDTTTLLLEGFLERTKGRCCLVSWVPQKRVLGHPAVGAFLTHCGWNSTMESIAMGVPLLAWPYFADQPFNSCYIALQWKVGLAFRSKLGEGVVSRGEVEGMIRRLMETEEGDEIRQRCHAWRDVIACVVQEGGSSHASFHKFIHYMKTLSHG